MRMLSEIGVGGLHIEFKASTTFNEYTTSYFHNHSTNIHGSRGGGGGLKFNQKKLGGVERVISPLDTGFESHPARWGQTWDTMKISLKFILVF